MIYQIASIGSIGGGYLPEWFMKRGWTASGARKTAMLICAIAVIPIVFASGVQNKWVATLLIGLACAAHQGWSANVFTIVSDSFPKAAVGTVTGFGGMAGAVGGMFISKITGYLLQTTGSYFAVFLMAGSIYLIALGIVQLLVPKIQMVETRHVARSTRALPPVAGRAPTCKTVLGRSFFLALAVPHEEPQTAIA